MVFLLGVLLFVAGMSALDWDFYKLDTTTYTAKNFTPAPEQTVTRVELDVDSFPVTVTVGDALALSYFEAGDSNVSVTCEDGVLKVKEDYTYRFMKNSWFNFGRLKRKYELTLPQGVEIVLVGSSGDVTLNGLQLGDLAVNSANLDLILRDCTFQSLTVESANADIELYNCTGGKVSAEGVNLDFEAQGCAFASLYVKGTNADVELVNVTAPAMEYGVPTPTLRSKTFARTRSPCTAPTWTPTFLSTAPKRTTPSKRAGGICPTNRRAPPTSASRCRAPTTT